ncbi:MAG: hypothetical protein ACLP50_26760 [Solirubrobacteraceae bacterium]
MATYTQVGVGGRAGWRGMSVRPVARHSLAGIVVAVLAAAATKFLLAHTTIQGVAAFITVAGALWCLSTRRTELALAVLMFYLGALDGYLKLATGSGYVTFVRDVLLYAIVIGVLVRAVANRRPLSLPPLSGWAIGFVLIVLAEVANPANGTLYHSLAGVRQSVEFVPLFFLTFAYVRTTQALRRFIVLLLLLAAANGIANVIQYDESPQQLAAWGPGYAERVLGTNGFSLAGRNFFTASGQQLTRPFGLGSDSGDGGLVDAFALAGVLALTSLPARRRYVPFALVCAAIAIAGVITAQGRAVIVCALVVLLAYAILSATSKRGVATALSIAAVGLVGYVIVGALAGGGSSPAIRGASLTSTNVLSLASQDRGKSYSAIPSYLVRYPFGAGLGVAGPATGTSGAPPQAGTLDAENEISFAILETGIPGMVVLVGFTLAVFLIGLRRCRSEPDPEARVLLSAIVAPIGGMIALYAVSASTPTTPGGPYLWAVGGIVAYWFVARPAELRGRLRSAAPAPQPMISAAAA